MMSWLSKRILIMGKSKMPNLIHLQIYMYEYIYHHNNGIEVWNSLFLSEKIEWDWKLIFCICLDDSQTITDSNKITKIFFNIIITDHIQNEIMIDDIILFYASKERYKLRTFFFFKSEHSEIRNSNNNIKSNSNDKRRFG